MALFLARLGAALRRTPDRVERYRGPLHVRLAIGNATQFSPRRRSARATRARRGIRDSQHRDHVRHFRLRGVAIFFTATSDRVSLHPRPRYRRSRFLSWLHRFFQLFDTSQVVIAMLCAATRLPSFRCSSTRRALGIGLGGGYALGSTGSKRRMHLGLRHHGAADSGLQGSQASSSAAILFAYSARELWHENALPDPGVPWRSFSIFGRSYRSAGESMIRPPLAALALASVQRTGL